MMFGSIMKRSQMAPERICELECEMKTLKEWNVDQQPQIKVFEMKQNKATHANHDHGKRMNI